MYNNSSVPVPVIWSICKYVACISDVTFLSDIVHSESI